jgi:uncharacterized protein
MTQPVHPDALLIRDVLAALERGDDAWLDEHISDDIAWHVGGNSKWAGIYRGKAELREFQAHLARAMTNPPKSEVHDILGSDDNVVVLGSATATADDGSSSEWNYVSIFHVTDGRVVEVWGMTENDAVVDPFLDKLPD